MKSCIRHFTAVCLFIVFLICSPDAAHGKSGGNGAGSSSNVDSSYTKGVTSGRAKSLVGVALGVFSIGIGLLAKRRMTVNKKNGRTWGLAALILAISAFLLSIGHLVTTTGGFGTGGGKAGGYCRDVASCYWRDSWSEEHAFKWDIGVLTAKYRFAALISFR